MTHSAYTASGTNRIRRFEDLIDADGTITAMVERPKAEEARYSFIAVSSSQGPVSLWSATDVRRIIIDAQIIIGMSGSCISSPSLDFEEFLEMSPEIRSEGRATFRLTEARPPVVDWDLE